MLKKLHVFLFFLITICIFMLGFVIGDFTSTQNRKAEAKHNVKYYLVDSIDEKYSVDIENNTQLIDSGNYLLKIRTFDSADDILQYGEITFYYEAEGGLIEQGKIDMFNNEYNSIKFDFISKYDKSYIEVINGDIIIHVPKDKILRLYRKI